MMDKIVIRTFRIKANEAITVTLEEGFEHYFVFYPADTLVNKDFLSATYERGVVKCENKDTVFEHRLTVAQFNGSLPELLYGVFAWQILVADIFQGEGTA